MAPAGTGDRRHRRVDGLHDLSEQATIAESVHTIGLPKSHLPFLFSLATDWMTPAIGCRSGHRPVHPVDRVDLIEAGIRVSLKLPSPIMEAPGCERCRAEYHARLSDADQTTWL